MDPIEEIVCGLPVNAPIPCTGAEAEIEWWTEHAEAGWGESPAKSLLSADRQTLFTAAVLHGDNDGGSGCLVTAVDTTNGSLLWNTAIPDHLGCGLIMDLEVEPSSGDLLLTAWDWGDSYNTGLHRIDNGTGAVQWHSVSTDTVMIAVTVDEVTGTAYVVGFREDPEDVPAAFLLDVNLNTGTRGPEKAFQPDGKPGFVGLDAALSADRETVLVSGWAIEPDPEDPRGLANYTAGVHAVGTDGSSMWTAYDPTSGNSFAEGLEYSADRDRVFLASTNGILTINSTTGTVIGLAPFEGLDFWDDIMLYDVAYDEAADIAAVAGWRKATSPPSNNPASGSLAVIAARGEDGALLWDRNVVLASGPVVAATPSFAPDGSLWFAGATDTGGYRTVAGSLDPLTGLTQQKATLVPVPDGQTIAHFVGALGSDRLALSGALLRERPDIVYETVITFDE